MKTLSVVRHAKSCWDDPDLDDHDRPLNKRGNHDAPKMAMLANQMNIKPEIILSSTAVRAWETAKQFSALLAPQHGLQSVPELYHASIYTMMTLIVEEGKGFDHIMIVGHNPGLESLVNRLGSEEILKFPTTAHAVIEFESDDWEQAVQSRGRTVHYDYPKKHFY